ncbi:Glycosyltransferase AER61, uncharacterised [Phaffia rhodozyma]|uniref:Glycosyltransferase AER61, uncharacterized n=1 Tax=Phaffia rhodozyma TaxID=264483 RepID=A0A0F7SWG3_PHARH|nr:Glycosyltransferase AER61, uncharacterised [Phaffia rhodozyma]
MSGTPSPLVIPALRSLEKDSLPLAQGPPSPSLTKHNGLLPYPISTHKSTHYSHSLTPPPSSSSSSSSSSYSPSSSFRRKILRLPFSLFGLLSLLAITLFCLLQLDLDISYTDRNGHERVLQLGLANKLTQWRPGTTAIPYGHDRTGYPTETQLVVHSPGWTVFTNLYQINQTYLIVTSNPSAFPPERMMISTGQDIRNDHENIRSREPTEKDIRIITPAQALLLFPVTYSSDGTPLGALVQHGHSWIVNDPPQFINHYYHFAAECLYGLWRTYSSLIPGMIADKGEHAQLQMPNRLIFARTGSEEWKDYSGMNALLMQAVLPNATVEFKKDSVNSDRPVVYEQVLLADRAAAYRGDRFAATQRSASEAFLLPSTPNWWAPVRNSLMDHIGGVAQVDLIPGMRPRPVVTYVSRQSWGRRMLKPEDHERLVETLTRASIEDDWELNVVEMDKLSNEEQIRLAARTTILMGVHGNGLTHLLWMKPEIRTTVMEFFYPDGFAHDYEFTSRGLDMQYFGFWGSRTFTPATLPPVNYPEGFQGNEIPVDADVVLSLVRMKLSNEEESDDG